MIEFTKTDELQDMSHVESEIKKELFDLQSGQYIVDIRKPKRTPAQNNLLHGAIFPQTADFLNKHNVPLSFGKGTDASWTDITAKEIFFKTLYTGGRKTSDLSTKELSDAVNALERDWNIKGESFVIDEKHYKEYKKIKDAQKQSNINELIK